MKVLERQITYGPFLERLRSAPARLLCPTAAPRRVLSDRGQAPGRVFNASRLP